MLTRLGVLLRSSFTETDRERVPLRRELELLESYVEIMRARFRGRLTFELDVAPATLDALVPRFIQQP
jgi:LytS/YehU family sensor histidine kinase